MPKTRVRCPEGSAGVVNTILARTKSYPKTAGIMLKQYKTKIWLEIQDPITGAWHK